MKIRSTWMFATLPAALAVLLFVQTLWHPFFYDDIAYVERNPIVRAREFSLGAFLRPFSPAAPGLYRPVTVLSYALDGLIGGMQPWVFHMTNVLLHAANALLVFLLLLALFCSSSAPEPTTGSLRSFALLGALVFAAHPVHTEAVTWVSGRSELLAAAFVLVGALVHLQSVGARHALLLQLGSAFAYFLALSSKEIAAPFPFILALLPFVLPHAGNRDRRGRILALLFVCIAFGIYLLLRMSALGSLTIPLAHTRTAGLPTIDRLLLMLPVLARYCALMVFPWGLRIEYDWSTFPWFVAFGSASLIALVLTLGYFCVRRGNRIATFGIAWFFLFLLPVANIIPIGELIAERFTYLPSVGFCIFMGALCVSYRVVQPVSLDTIPHRHDGTGSIGMTRLSVLGYLFLPFIILVFSFLTVRRNSDWSNPETLWRKTLVLSPEAPHARENLTALLLARGELKEAGSFLSEELQRFPEKPMLHFLAGQFFRRGGDDARAREHFAMALELGKPEDIEFTDFQRASVLLELDRFAEALPLLERAVSENPFDPSLLNNLGVAQAKLGMFTEAMQSFERAIALFEEQGNLNEEDKRNLEGAKRNVEMLQGMQ